MKNSLTYILIGLVFGSCSPKDAMFSLMTNIKTHNAIYQNQNNEIDTIQMGFKFHKPPIDLGSNKPFRVLTKSKNNNLRRYELRSIQFDTTSWMEHVELFKDGDNSSSVILTEHEGKIKKFKINDKSIPVYKQTYNKSKNPIDNYSEFFTTKHGLILISDNISNKELIEYNGKDINSEIAELIKRIKVDSIFYPTDTISIFKTWEEKY